MKTLILILAAFVLSSIAYSEVDDCLCVPNINPNYPFEDSVKIHQDTILYFDTCGTEFSRSYRSCDSIFWYSYNYNGEGQENLYAQTSWSIDFTEVVFDIPLYDDDTLIFVGWQDMDTSYSEIRQHFREIEEWYGSYIMGKRINSTNEPPSGQQYQMAFDSTLVNIETIKNKLDSINEFYNDIIIMHNYNYYPYGHGNSVVENKRQFEFIQSPSNLIIKINENDISGDIIIYDAYGREWYSIPDNLQNELQIDISSYPSGLYFIQVGNYFDKFMVIR